MKYYGFTISNNAEKPAWFHTKAAASRFNAACGGDLGPIEQTRKPEQNDIMDLPRKPWRDRWRPFDHVALTHLREKIRDGLERTR